MLIFMYIMYNIYISYYIIFYIYILITMSTYLFTHTIYVDVFKKNLTTLRSRARVRYKINA